MVIITVIIGNTLSRDLYSMVYHYTVGVIIPDIVLSVSGDLCLVITNPRNGGILAVLWILKARQQLAELIITIQFGVRPV